MASVKSSAVCENDAASPEMSSDKPKEELINTSADIKESSNNPEIGQSVVSETLSKSKNALSSHVTDASTTAGGDGIEPASDGERMEHVEVVATIPSPPSKRLSKVRHRDKKMHGDLLESNISIVPKKTTRGRPRCQRSSHRERSRYREVINSLCSEIDRMATQLRSKVKKELSALAYKERESSACHCYSSESRESSCENNHKLDIKLDETSSGGIGSDTESVTMSSGAVQCCGCVRHHKSPNQRSKDTSRSSYQPISLLRHPQKAKLIHTPSSEDTVGLGDNSWYTHLEKIKQTMDEKHIQLRQLWSKPIGDCQEADGNAHLSWSSPLTRSRQVSTSLSELLVT